MHRYACDLCGQDLAADAPRYEVRVELQHVFDPMVEDEPSDDRDYLEEIHEILQQAADEPLMEPVEREMQFDLCPGCAERFAKNPLGRKLSKQFNFSKN